MRTIDAQDKKLLNIADFCFPEEYKYFSKNI